MTGAWPRAAGPVTLLTGIVLLAAACGGGHGGSGGPAASASGPATQQQALAYSQCMRSHGDPGFPDAKQGPGGAWLYPEDPQTSQYFSGPAYDVAQKACRKLQPSGEITPAERQAAINQLLALGRCMRAHGITNFPDPSSHGPGVGLVLPNSIDFNSPQFQAAQRACHMPGP